jgi:hypothetical protein
MSVGGLRFRRDARTRAGRGRAVILAALAFALATPAAAQGVTITFEDLTPHPPPYGGAGQAVNVQYSGQGVTFNNPSAFDYGPGFAHSGTVAVEPCFGQEFCTSPVRADFTTAQRTVGVWVGHTGTFQDPVGVRLTGFDASSNVIGTADATLPAASTAVTTHLTIDAPPARITRIEVSVTTGGGFTGGLVVDDVEFSTAGPPPPCNATAPPTVTLTQPPGFQTYHLNQFPLAGSVDPHGAPLTAASITSTSEMSGPKTASLFPALIRPEAGNFGPVRLNGFLYAPNPDLHDIAITATNCKGTGTSETRRVFWAPLPSTTRFEQVGQIEVTQSVQTPVNGVPLIAGGPSGIKRTFARVYLSVAGGAPEVRHMTGTLTATLPDGSRAPGPLRAYSINPAPAYGFAFPDQIEDERSRLQDPLLFELPPEWVTAGRIHLQLEHISIDGEESHFPCDACENIGPLGFPPVPGPAQVRFHAVPPLRIWLISMPYRLSPSGAPLTPAQAEIDAVASIFRRMYPTADVQVNQATLPIADSPPKTCSEAKNRVAQWGQSLAAQDPRARFLGLLERDPSVTVEDGDGNVIGGCAERPGHFGWVFADDDIGAAHEIGHTFGRKHVAGCQLFAGSAVDSDYPHPFGLIGDDLLGDAVGFDAGDSAVLAPMQVHDWRKGVADVMSYCSKKWLSDYNYGQILGELCDADQGNCPDHAAITGHSRRLGGARAAALVARLAPGGPRLSVLGSVSADGRRASLDSLAVLERGPLSPRRKHGGYAIVLRDARGRVLGRYGFKPTDVGEDVRNSIDEVVPFKRGTRRIEVVAGSRRLAAARVSAHAPSVTVTAPNGGGKLGKRVTVRWRSRDADGGRRTYTVLYSPGGKRSIPIATGVHGSSLRVDLAGLPGGEHARFEVIANDRVRTGGDTSRPFKVGAKKPRVSISTPATGAELAADQLVQLVATVDDPQDVRFEARHLVWRSSIQGKLGRGTAIAAALTAGTHKLTATATNSAGKKAKASVTVNVTAPPPVFTIAP